MLKVIIVGTGNVSYHLQNAFSQSKSVDVIDVLPSRSDFGRLFSKKKPDYKFIDEADVFIIAVSDDAIKTVSGQFKNIPKLIVHTSGSVSINAIPKEVRQGVFYPLQTFSKERQVDFKTIPICIEAKELNDLELLKALARAISDKVYEMDSKQRKALHLAAVFVNNFTNHLYQIGNEICQENKVSFDLLKPLISETASKIETLDPIDVQTGPAKRHDKNTIEHHLAQLNVQKHREIYTLLTQSIKETHGEKL